MGWAQTEKKALAATLRRSDPLRETLCTGWDTRRLLAHLVQREQDHLGAALDALGRPAPGQERNLGKLVAGAATPTATRPWSTGSSPARPAGRRSAGPPSRSTCWST